MGLEYKYYNLNMEKIFLKYIMHIWKNKTWQNSILKNLKKMLSGISMNMRNQVFPNVQKI